MGKPEWKRSPQNPTGSSSFCRLGGSDAYREMRRHRSDVQVVLTSGFAAEEATCGFEGKGLTGFLRKPFRADELTKIVFDAVGP